MRQSLLLITPVCFAVGCGRIPLPQQPVQEVAAESALVESLPQASTVDAGDWPWWRGPQRSGVATGPAPRVSFDPATDLLWKTTLPGVGYSTPCIMGDFVFLTSATENPQQQMLLAFDRKSGNEQWRTVLHEGGFMNKHLTNSFASASPACDEQNTFTAFINAGALHVSAVDRQGKIAWQTKAGPFTSEHGYGPSPVLYRGLVIVNGDNLSGSFIAALNAKTGDVVWRTARQGQGRHGSYATPVVADVAGQTQLLLTGLGKTSSYDPVTGKLNWSCDGPATVTACTPAFSDELVFVTGGYPEKNLFAVTADGSATKLWTVSRNVAYVPTPVYHDGRVYVVSDNGVASCLEAADGNEVWKGRLGGTFSASPTLAGDHLFVTNHQGELFVVEAKDRFNIASTIPLHEECRASPVILNGTIYLRTHQSLMCVKSPDATAESSDGS